MKYLLAAILVGVGVALAGEPVRPAVLFVGGLHANYLARPMFEADIDVDVCQAAELPRQLAGNRYNVIVAGTSDAAVLAAIDGFLAGGGGVLMTNPESNHHRTAEWTLTNEWLAKQGAKPRWEQLLVADPATLLTDSMGVRHAVTADVAEPFKTGVRGLLVLTWGSPNPEPPMSFDLDTGWQAVVRGPEAMRGEWPTQHSDMEYLGPWKPAAAISSAPPLLAVRDIGKGRLAVVAYRRQWLIDPPSNCPTAEATLTKGIGSQPSDWARLLANTCRYLAEPSIQAGWGGMRTPHVVLEPPVKLAPVLEAFDWANAAPMVDQPQLDGLVGARSNLSGGEGTVAEFAAAARAAGLSFIVFLEDGLKLNQGTWDELVKQCAAVSTETFGAIPGLLAEDAQGNRFFCLGDGAKFPQPGMVLADGRLDTTAVSRTEAMFKWIIQYMKYDTMVGYWSHAGNEVHWADYKLNNSWCLFSRGADGKEIDSALEEYLYWQGYGGEHALFAFEFMTRPEQVAERAATGWRVVGTSTMPRPPFHYYTPTKAEGLAGLRERWKEGNHWYPAYQYVTQGPRIAAWETENYVVVPWGEWWRPDVWELRVRLSVQSDAGIKEIVIHDGDRGVFRRFLPDGAKSFEHTMVLTNCQQRDLVPIVTDMNGKQAIGMSIYNRNTMLDQFACGDRCNFLGRSTLRTRDGRPVYTPPGFRANLGISPSKGSMDLIVQPDISTTLDTPTLPIDGKPIGAPEFTLHLEPVIAGELARPFAFPTNYLIGPDMGIGQGTYALGYDPTEYGATETRLGHPYKDPEKQGKIGFNAWTSWYRLVPLKKVKGYARINVCGWMPEAFRVGWVDLHLEAIDTIEVPAEGLSIGYVSARTEIYRNGKPSDVAAGPFTPGTIAVVPTGLAIPMDDSLSYERKETQLRFYYRPGKTTLNKGDTVDLRLAFAGTAQGTPKEQILAFAEQFGISQPGQTAWQAKVLKGKTLQSYLTWQAAAEDGYLRAQFPRTELNGHLTAMVSGLNDRWSVHLADLRRQGVNFRGLPHRDGVAYAQLDLTQAATDWFVGHPVTASDPEVTVLVAWMEPGKWYVEAHNPGEAKKSVELASSPGWPRFSFLAKADLAPGSSRTWVVAE